MARFCLLQPRAAVWLSWLGAAGMWLLVCYLFAITSASASVTSPYLRTNHNLDRGQASSVGYQIPWLHRMRQHAVRTVRNDEPYLANHCWRLLARYWWHAAAQHGDALAEFNLGALFVNNQHT